MTRQKKNFWTSSGHFDNSIFRRWRTVLVCCAVFSWLSLLGLEMFCCPFRDFFHLIKAYINKYSNNILLGFASIFNFCLLFLQMTKVVETHTHKKKKLKNSALSASMDQQYWTIFSTTNSVKVSRPWGGLLWCFNYKQQPFLNCDLVAINRDFHNNIFFQ